MKLTGSNDDDQFVNYYPFSRDGPARPPAAKPSGGAGQDKDGDGKSDAPSTEIMSTRDDANDKRPGKQAPGSPWGPGSSDGGGGRGGPQGPGGPRDPGNIDESTPLGQWRQ
eukprot:2907153-Pyramimonas_sp.AAC.1